MDGGGQGGMPGHGLLPEPTLVRPVVPTADRELADAMASGANPRHWFTFGLEAEASSSADATDKRPWALVVEGDVHCYGNRVAVSRGGVLSYQLTFDEHVLSAVWCRFADLAPHAALCVVMRRSMYVHSASGARHEVPLPINVQRVWSLGTALLLAREITEAELQSKPSDELAMPTLFSLHNPLEQLRPVVIAPETANAAPNVLNVMLAVVGVIADPRLLVLQDAGTGQHSVWEWTTVSSNNGDTAEPSPAPVGASSAKPAAVVPGTPFTPVPARAPEAPLAIDGRRSNLLASSLAATPFPTTPQVRPHVSLPSSAQYSSPMRRMPQAAATPLPTLALDTLTPVVVAAPDAIPGSRARPGTPRSASRPGTPSSANRLPRKARSHRVIEQQLQAVVYLRLLAQLTDTKGAPMDARAGRFLPATRVFAAHALNGEPVVFLHFDAPRRLLCVPLYAHGSPSITLPEPSLYASLCFRWAARTPYTMEEVVDAAPVICTRSWTRSQLHPDLYDLLVVRPEGSMEVLMGCQGTPMRVGVPAGGHADERADPQWTPLKRWRSNQSTPQAMQLDDNDGDGDDDGAADMDMSLDDNESMLISPLAAAKVAAAMTRANETPASARTARAAPPASTYATIKQVLFPVGPNVTLVTAERGFVRYSFNFAPRTVLVRHCMDALRFVLPPDAWRGLLCDFFTISGSNRAADEWLAFVTALSSLFAAASASPTATPARPALHTSRHAWLAMLAGARRMYPGDALFGLVEALVNDRRLVSPGKTSRDPESGARSHMPQLPPRGAPIELLPAALLALHLAYEDAKLDVHLQAACTAMCRTVLLPIARKLHWSAWNEAYVREAPPSDASTQDSTVDFFRLHAVDVSQWPEVPPAVVAAAPEPGHLSLQATLLALIERGSTGAAAPSPTFPSLARLRAVVPADCMAWRPTDELLGLFDPVCARSQTMLAVAEAIGQGRHLDAIDRLEADRWSQHDIAALPLGLSMHVLQCLHCGRAAPRAHWSPSTLVMIGRDDLAWQMKQPVTSTAWMRHVGDSTQFPRELKGTEVDCMNLIKLKFPSDMRFFEVQRLLSSARSPRLKPDGDINEHAVLQVLKQELALRLHRTQAMGVGRGALVLESSSQSLQRSFEFPEMAKVGVTPANVTVQPLTQSTARWPDFHNGVAAALRIPRKHPLVDRTWILYNKSGQYTTDGGFFLGLGLTGHLASLDWVVIRKSFRTADSFLIVGVILGLSAMHAGTMHSNTSHMLYTHIPPLLPSYVDELSTPPLIRTAALMGIGLVYLGQGQRQLSAVMVGEIAAASGLVSTMQSLALTDSHDSQGWSNLSECYAFTAGAALGLINLAAGQRGVVAELNLAHTLGQIVRGRTVPNSRGEPQKVLPAISRTGAMVALGLVFMRTSDAFALEMLPNYSGSRSAMDTLTPEQMAVCVICRALINWDSIRPDAEWLLAQVPEWMYSELPRAVVFGRPDHPEPLAIEDSPQRWYHAVLAGAVHAMGLCYAGTGNPEAYAVAASLLEFGISLFGGPTSVGEDRGGRLAAVRMLLSSSALAIGMIMAGTGDLRALQRLRVVHNIVRPFTHFGYHMATHMAIGFLFLGATRFSFGTTPRDTAMLFISTFPVFPMTTDDCRNHLQAYRHFYHMAAHCRSLLTWDVEAAELCAVPVKIVLRDGHVVERQTPCLLPELSTVERVVLGGERYWERTLETSDPAHLALLSGSQVIYVRRRAGYTDSVASPTDAVSLLARVALPALPDVPLQLPSAMTLTGLSDAALVRQATKDALVEGLALHVMAASAADDDGGAVGAATASLDRFTRLAALACVGGDRIAAIAPLLALFRATQTATPAAATAAQFARALVSMRDADATALFPASLLRALLDAFDRRIDAVAAQSEAALRHHVTLPALPSCELSARVAAVLTHKRAPLVDALRRALNEAEAVGGGPAAQVSASGAREALLLAALHASGVAPMPTVSQLRWLLACMAAPPHAV